MVSRGPRILLMLTSLLLGLGSALHALAFHKAVMAVASSDLPPFFGKALKGLWLADSTTMFALALIFALFAIKPGAASRPVVIMTALVPAGIAAMIYLFMGAFFAGHLLLVSALLAFVAGLQFPATSTSELTVRQV